MKKHFLQHYGKLALRTKIKLLNIHRTAADKIVRWGFFALDFVVVVVFSIGSIHLFLPPSESNDIQHGNSSPQQQQNEPTQKAILDEKYSTKGLFNVRRPIAVK